MSELAELRRRIEALEVAEADVGDFALEVSLGNYRAMRP